MEKRLLQHFQHRQEIVTRVQWLISLLTDLTDLPIDNLQKNHPIRFYKVALRKYIMASCLH